MNRKSKYVIIGNGNASKSAVEALCKASSPGEILIISEENYKTYTPTILPYFILGTIPEKDLFLSYWPSCPRRKIQFLLGKEVTAVFQEKNKILLDQKEEVFFESLLIATGASSAFPSIEGLNEGPVFALRTLEDAKAIKEALPEKRHAAIVGAGYIGMHLAEVFVRLGIQTTVIEMEDRVLSKSFDGTAALIIQKIFEVKGVQFRLSCGIRAVEHGRQGSRIFLTNGSQLDADMIVFATGVRPNLSFVLGSGIDIDQGILVDDFMRTNFSHIFAAGDVAQSRNFLTGQKTLNPILPEAVLHGKIAAINMAGGEASFRGNIPRNTFHFFDHFAFSIGLVDLDSRDFEVHVKNEPERHRYRKLIFRGDHLVGALGINETLDPGALLSIIVKGLGLDELKREFHAPYMNCSGWLRWIVEEKVGLGRSGGPL